MTSKKPNILFFHVDNLGMGELGCYGGGILRGADTKRMDNFAEGGCQADALRRRAAMHADALGADDRALPDPLRQPYDRARRQCRRPRPLGADHRARSCPKPATRRAIMASGTSAPKTGVGQQIMASTNGTGRCALMTNACGSKIPITFPTATAARTCTKGRRSEGAWPIARSSSSRWT